MSFYSGGNDSQGSYNDPNSSELELDDSEGGDSELESDTPAESEAMDKDRDMNNMDIDGEEINDPPENSIQVPPTQGLYHAPQIPAGIQSFQRIPVESGGI